MFFLQVYWFISRVVSQLINLQNGSTMVCVYPGSSNVLFILHKLFTYSLNNNIRLFDTGKDTGNLVTHGNFGFCKMNDIPCFHFGLVSLLYIIFSSIFSIIYVCNIHKICHFMPITLFSVSIKLTYPQNPLFSKKGKLPDSPKSS